MRRGAPIFAGRLLCVTSRSFGSVQLDADALRLQEAFQAKLAADAVLLVAAERHHRHGQRARRAKGRRAIDVEDHH
jgi:hypothetical protein